jgi:Cysteine dioxygenase type I
MTITQAAAPGPTDSHLTRSSEPSGGRAGLDIAVGPLELLGLVQHYVESLADVLPRASHDLPTRSYELLELTDDLEIWAIHWPRDQGLELHDHGGSSGALWVVDGALEEHSLGRGGGLIHRTLEVGGGSAFGPTHIHDVVNTGDVPATSVHVYSPPMASMTFYRREGSGLVVERAEYRADPAWAP